MSFLPMASLAPLHHHVVYANDFGMHDQRRNKSLLQRAGEVVHPNEAGYLRLQLTKFALHQRLEEASLHRAETLNESSSCCKSCHLFIPFLRPMLLTRIIGNDFGMNDQRRIKRHPNEAGYGARLQPSKFALHQQVEEASLQHRAETLNESSSCCKSRHLFIPFLRAMLLTRIISHNESFQIPWNGSYFPREPAQY
jgi:hypothetical protein